jgi:hypothetical protein
MSFPLPHTSGCLVCGRDNPHGLHLDFTVDPSHGGILATVFDEAMVWAATWQGKRFCVCGELTVRFRRTAQINHPLTIQAKITDPRPRLIQTSATAHDADGKLIAESTGKYVPVPADRHAAVVQTFVAEPSTAHAAAQLNPPK